MNTSCSAWKHFYESVTWCFLYLESESSWCYHQLYPDRALQRRDTQSQIFMWHSRGSADLQSVGLNCNHQLICLVGSQIYLNQRINRICCSLIRLFKRTPVMRKETKILSQVYLLSTYHEFFYIILSQSQFLWYKLMHTFYIKIYYCYYKLCRAG